MSTDVQTQNGNGDMITDDEAALYDRQIRLWGVDAQKKLRSSNVLLFGLSGVGSEIAKNIVLAGINSLTVVDHKTITEHDSLSNLFTYGKVGSNRALESLPNIKTLNPMVNVKALDLDIKELLDEKDNIKLRSLLEDVHVVCLTNSDSRTAIRLNNLVRSQGIKFYWANCWGFYGCSFHDLGKHSCTIEGDSEIKADVDLSETNSGEPAAKKARQDDEPAAQTQYTQKEIIFPTLEATLAVRAGKAGVGLTKRTNPVFLLTHVMLAFYKKFNRFPNDRVADKEPLIQLQKEVIEQRLDLDSSVTKKLEDLQWWDKVFGELSPVSSVVGGVVGQDIIRAVSEKENPIKNVFVFNGIACAGTILTIGK